ncbi:T9SS type A sorting domain-containing protein [Fluviicola taffensis]|uniref:T9SS type A sorting domain-containing protein n=1 Tax=Fluviicola taffensis TaxID=191579 RepID=UPI003137ECED
MKLLLSYIALLLVSTCALAQPGANDPTFNTFDDGAYGDGSGFNNTVFSTVVQPDGKIIAGGHFTLYNGIPRTRIARLNADGSLDTTFNPGTGFDWIVYSVSLQTDGKIIVGGEFDYFNGVSRRSIARLNTDGSLDLSFHPVGGTVNCCGLNNEVLTVAIQPDGKIIAGGAFTNFGNNYQGHIIRFNTNGSMDPTFNIGTGFNDWVHAITLQPDGKVVVTGSFTSFNGTSINRIARINANGSLDTIFNPGTGFNNLGTVRALSLQPDGKIIAGGGFSHFNGTPRNKIARLNSDGSLDTSFDPGTGFSGSGAVTSIILQPNGKIMVSGIFFVYNGTSPRYILRLNTDASVDPTFVTGTSFTGTIYETVRQPDGKFVCVGDFASYNGTPRSKIARLNPDGDLDFSFNPGSGANKQVDATAIQPDGKIIVGGNFTLFNGNTKNRIARLNADGSLDAGFDPGTGFNGETTTLAVQSDGKIIVGGAFTTFNGTTRNRIVRLNTDGSIDVGFTIGTGFTDTVRSIVIQADGKVIVGGKFTSFNGTARNRIVRLNTNGTLDATFNPGTGFNNPVSSLAVQSDGQIIVGGDFTSFNATTINRLARLNTNGTLDLTLNPGSGFNQEVRSTAIQADGKIIAGGLFTTFNGTAINRIARLNSDGSSDLSFIPGMGFNDSVSSIAIQADGKIIVGGNFTSFNGTARNRIVRLNPDGSLNALFNPGSGFVKRVRSLSIQSDGKVIVGGDFSSFNGIARNRIGRLLANCPAISSGITTTDISCFNSSNGEIDLTPTGGFAPYTFIWNDGSVAEDRTGLAAGSYSVIINDAIGCSINVNTLVTEPASPFSTATNITNVSCFGGSNGEIDLIPSGGTIPYSFDWGGGITTEDRTGLPAGTYAVTITDVNGCATISVTVTQPASALSGTTSVTPISCYGGANGGIDLTPAGGTAPYSFDWGSGVTAEDRTGLSVGTYPVTISDANGCSTVLSPLVTQAAPITNAFASTACYSYTWNAQNYTSSGSYTQSFTAINGCDSTVTLNLTIHNATAGSLTQTACNSFTLNGQTYTTSGIYTQNLMNAAGCDSTLTLNLTINHPTTSSLIETACDAFTLNGQTYSTSGTYIQHLTNAAGCDSALTLNLTIIQATTNTITEAACYSFTLNGQTYTASGIYTQHLTNAAGCDSTLILNLTINGTTTSSQTQTACNSFTLNGQTYTASGTYIQNLVNTNGCDSVLTLNLTINHPTTSSITQTACDAFTLNGQNYTTTGIYTQNLTNAAGCDSTLTLNLTINHSPNMTAVDNGNASITASQASTYQWIDCSTGNALVGANSQTFTASINGIYAVIGTSTGCSDTSNCITIDNLGLGEQSLFDLRLAPNPTQDLIAVQFEGMHAWLTIRDAQGKQLARQHVVSGEQISLKNYADGVYLFEFHTTKGIATRRVVKN